MCSYCKVRHHQTQYKTSNLHMSYIYIGPKKRIIFFFRRGTPLIATALIFDSQWEKTYNKLAVLLYAHNVADIRNNEIHVYYIDSTSFSVQLTFQVHRTFQFRIMICMVVLPPPPPPLWGTLEPRVGFLCLCINDPCDQRCLGIIV